MPENQPANPPKAGLYVDGFNLYHGIEKFGEPWLKWLNLRKLGEPIAARHGAVLERVVFCSAVPDHVPQDTKDRHMLYHAALRSVSVDIEPGHHIWNDDLKKYSEKQSDINVALSLMADAEDKKIQVAILVSADSDQAATARFFRQRHPKNKLILAVPPNKTVPQKVVPYTNDHFILSRRQIDDAAFQQTIQGKTRAIVRPDAYQPPAWWVHPDDRP